MKIKLFCFITLLLSLPVALMGTHLVGGEMSYTCLGNHNYQITLVIYRDCISPTNSPFDPSAVISIYKNGVLYKNDPVPLGSSTPQLPLVPPNNCTTLPPSVCTEKGTYTYTAYLPPTPGGYTISHQRCCRNNTISNINNANSQWGSTFTIDIPANDTACNTSPKYKDDPPVMLCLNVPVELDLSVNEPDGDSIFYKLCSVLNGGANATGLIAPDPASPPPYLAVPFVNGYNTAYPISSSPAFAIHPSTGKLAGTPNTVGQYVFAICAKEYRNGILLSTNRRDFQFNVSPDCEAPQSKIKLSNGNIVRHTSPTTAAASALATCNGITLRISQATSNATAYYWDFGDPTSTGDTSRAASPTYTYADTGTYTVMLVIDPYTACADTSYAQVSLYDKIYPRYTYQGEMCFKDHSITFKNIGTYSPNALYTWNFGGNTNLGTTSSLRNPSGVVWNQIGAYYVTLTIEDFGCTGTYGDTLLVYPNPVAGENLQPTEACVPHTQQFTDNSLVYGKSRHYWSFGDGGGSNEKNPIHTYTEPGTYTVTHAVLSLEGCIDSSVSVKKNIITIHPVPEAALHIEPKEQSIYNPVFIIEDRSMGHQSSITYLPDDRTVENLTRESLIIEDTGTYPIYHLTFNEYNCTDTTVEYVKVYSPFNLYMPNAFTPDGDGVNDVFRYTITGVTSSYIEIYNRWGEVVFKSANPYEGWNGRLQNTGPKAPPGVYTYVLKAEVKRNPRTHKRGGIIHLMR